MTKTTILLISPKFEMNVANVLRSLSVMGGGEIIVCNRRYTPATGEKGDRIPRPMRMKAYDNVRVTYNENLVLPPGNLVVVEKLDWATPLPLFDHPENAIYIFGPEDGSVPKWIVQKAKKHTIIPYDSGCSNLATSVGIVLYDKLVKSWQLQDDSNWRSKYV
jgi:tRNA(Leu) C34 or U34 (ribose-2'-O)-methylase TrmL